MTLAAGAKLGPYEIVAPIGAGGMGEVYRARDTRLNRDVAIKVLPASFASDADRRARFEREAQTVAALSHPNVLAIFDVGSLEGHPYIVTELLSGETLRERLGTPGAALPVRKAIDIAIQIARGLAAAHDKHLVHRDLKPENVFLITDGQVKILDFGLARQLQPASDVSETRGGTGAGVVMGTVGYMAPEQVRGEAVDARADVFAFGAVLYEMITGERAFARNTAAETMTAILREDPPPFSGSRATLPPALERIVRHCLEKNPAERFETARDLAFALETLTTPDVSSSGSMVAPAAASRSRPRRAVVASVALAGLGVAAYLWWSMTCCGPSAPAPSSALVIGTATQLTTDDGLEIDAALSPDGRVVAYAAGPASSLRIYLRPVIGGRTIPLSDSVAAQEIQPRWSPDGSQILFLRPDGVFVASSYGGAAQPVVREPAFPSGRLTGAAWAPDGKRVLIVRLGTLSVVTVDGRDERQIGTFAGELYACDWSPTGLIACASGNLLSVLPGNAFGNIAPSAIVVGREGQPFADVTDRSVLNHSPVWSGDGRWLYFVSSRQGPRDVYALDFRDGRPNGEPQRITTGSGANSVSLSHATNQLAYVSYTSKSNLWSLPIPRSGSVDAASAQQMTRGNQMIEAMQVAPDGKSILFDWTLHQNSDLYRKTIGDDSEPQRLTSDRLDNFAPALSPDQATIAYHAFVGSTRQIFLMPAQGGEARQITRDDNHHAYPIWSADGGAIAFINPGTPSTKPGYYVIRRGADGVWGDPVMIGDGLPGRRAAWIDRDTIAIPMNGNLQRVTVGGPATTLYARQGEADPVPESVQVADDRRTLYFKAHDQKGMAQIWALPIEGGRPRLVVTFTDPSRPSIRADFAAGAGRFFFTLEDRQADVWIADFTRK